MGVIARVSDILERRVFSPLKGPIPTLIDSNTGVRVRRYDSYEGYVRHQSAKLRRHFDALLAHDRAYEEIIAGRYQILDLRGKSILCAGARLGGEVRGFARLGALAIGLDLEPGPRNLHVLHGDVHALQFPDAVFDYVFTNILDHVLDLDRFVSEVLRVLKPDGRLIAELSFVPIKNYEVNDLTDGRVRAFLAERMQIESEAPVLNHTNFTAWSGVSAVYAQR